MTRAAWLGAWVLSLGLGVACGGSPEAERTETAVDDDFDLAESATVSETGCLTASGDRYVLTALEPSGAVGTAATELYRLLGEDEELRQLVGREVRVTGLAEPAEVAQVVETGPPAPAATSGSGSAQRSATTGQAQEGEPTVQTEAETRIETRQLRVATVTPTGTDCPTASAPQ
jgi:hypothetical protein